jgi:hypothetical protein
VYQRSTEFLLSKKITLEKKMQAIPAANDHLVQSHSCFVTTLKENYEENV